VLRDVRRLYLRLGEHAIETSDGEEQRDIGKSGGGIEDPTDLARGRRRTRSYLVIAGEDIANVVFDELAIDPDKLSEKEFALEAKREVGQLSETEENAVRRFVSELKPPLDSPPTSSPTEVAGPPVAP